MNLPNQDAAATRQPRAVSVRRAMALRGAALALAGRTPSMHAAQRTSPEVVLGGGEQQRLDLAQHQLRMHAWALEREHSACARMFACALRVRAPRATRARAKQGSKCVCSMV